MVQLDVLFFIDVLIEAVILWTKVASRRNGAKMVFFMLNILKQKFHSTSPAPKHRLVLRIASCVSLRNTYNARRNWAKFFYLNANNSGGKSEGWLC
jgi:hypothetical protein